MLFQPTVLSLALALVVAAQEPAINAYSSEKEAALGMELAKDVQRRTHPLQSDVIQKYVADLGDSLRKSLPDPTRTFTFSVITNPTGPLHEPLAIPGGHIFVPASLIREARNESEFAGMLAHAMAHILEYHGARLAMLRQISNSGSVPLVFVGAWTGPGSAGAVLIPAELLKYQRDLELEADRDAVRTMSSAGYDPRAHRIYRPRPAHSENVDHDGHTRTRGPDRKTRERGRRTAAGRVPAPQQFPADSEPGCESDAKEDGARSVQGANSRALRRTLIARSA